MKIFDAIGSGGLFGLQGYFTHAQDMAQIDPKSIAYQAMMQQQAAMPPMTEDQQREAWRRMQGFCVPTCTPGPDEGREHVDCVVVEPKQLSDEVKK